VLAGYCLERYEQAVLADEEEGEFDPDEGHNSPWG